MTCRHEAVNSRTGACANCGTSAAGIQLTGHAIIMGRVTYDSIGKPLPNRRNIVLSQAWHTRYENVPNLEVYENHLQALDAARKTDPSPFVIGGAEVWSALWPHVTHVELTRVHTPVGLGRCFGFHAPLWREMSRTARQEHEGLGHTFISYERIASDAAVEKGDAK